jgi:hypothetical protein
MYAKNTIENVTESTHRNSRAGRADSGANYIMTGIRTVLGAAAIALAVATTALAGGQALRVANGANVVEFANLPAGAHDEKPRVVLNSAAFGAPQGVVFDAANNLWVIDGGIAIMGGAIAPSLEEFTEHSSRIQRKVRRRRQTF